MAEYYDQIIQNTTLGLDLNETNSCPRRNYIPTVTEYSNALGAYGIVFLTIGSVATVLLYGLCIHQAWFTYLHAHKVFRRHIYWLISIYPMVTLMSTLALIVPRSHHICSGVKITYMCVGIGHFADLTILMFGGENKMLEAVENRKLDLSVLPLCCCLPCLPKPVISRMRLRVLKWMIWQMKFTQAIYYFFNVYARFSLQDSSGIVSSNTTALVLTVLNFVSFLSGVYALNIMERLVRQVLPEPGRYRIGNFGGFPCLGEFITPVVYENTLENSLLIVEMLVFGFFSYLMYSKPEFEEYKGEQKFQDHNCTRCFNVTENSANTGQSQAQGASAASSLSATGPSLAVTRAAEQDGASGGNSGAEATSGRILGQPESLV
ncbi:organic solute transporter alpha-like protein isoform X2 [Hyalella azteca]|uniref:Organic solute transporter alpha-like protein isoform X2 n=1 Tax=Hyalella azteca TaxID=294128 RepID=A0A8B7NMA8_HYAAZ|nr:organic solute transporter alpha-like protein isoform X2 [Hyalella azteca]